MKKILFVLSSVLLGLAGNAQFVKASPDNTPMYKKVNTIPYFQLIQGDSSWFKSTDLPKNKPVAIIYFSPDCGHCQLTAQEFAANMDKFKNDFLVWVSFHTPEQIKAFGEKYKLSQYRNVRLGRDTTYYIPSFYQVRFTPFMAAYNRQGKLVETFEGGTDPATLAKALSD